MADIEDLKNKVLHFKVIDLQSVLRHANSVKYGRKQELQKRVFDIIKRNPESIRNKVYEVYREIYGRFPRASCNDEYALEHFSNNTRGSAAKTINPQSLIFMKSPFFAILGRLMEPVVLAPSSRYSNVTEVRYWSFKLNLENANLLAQSRDTVRAHLKFCVTEMSKRRDTFPYGLSVVVNGQHVSIPQPASAREVDRKQQNYFVDITEVVRISPVATNNIKIQWIREPIVYGAIIHLVNVKAPGELVKTLAEEKVIPPLLTRAMIIQKLAPDSDGDDEISTTTLKASLICPLSKGRITVPCRPASCTHLQCFDVHKFLKLNEAKIFFTCPICHKSISFEELRIDSMFTDILSKAPDTCTEVEFHEDGRWSPGRSQKTGTKRSIEVIDLVSDDDVSTVSPIKKKANRDRNKSSVKDVSTAKRSLITSVARKELGSELKKNPKRNSSAHKFSLSKTKESLVHTPIIIQPHKSKSNVLNKNNTNEKRKRCHSENRNLISQSHKKEQKEFYTARSERSAISSQQIPIDYSLPAKSLLPILPKLPMIRKTNMFTTNVVPQNFSKQKTSSSNLLSRKSYCNQGNVPKMVPIDLTIASKVLKSSANVLNLSTPVKHQADVRMQEARLTSLKLNMTSGTSRHPNKYLCADTRNSSELKMQSLSPRNKKVQSTKHHLKYAPDVKIGKNTYMTNSSEHALGKLGKSLPLSYPLRQHPGLVPGLPHYAPMTSLSSIPSMVPPESVGFQSTKMLLPSKSENPCLHSPILQARCPPHMPFYPYNMQYYNQNPFGQFDFGNVFSDRVQGLPNIYSFLPSAIFPQNLHGITGDFLRKQAR